MRRGEILLKALETIGNMAIGTADFFEAFIRAGYGASSGRIQNELSKIEEKRFLEIEKDKIKQKYYNLIYKLKIDGLIVEKQRTSKKFFVLTKKGKNKLTLLINSFQNKLPLTTIYFASPNTHWIIIAFDIPEKERRKRDWIRETLKNMKFEILQKSVWIGKRKLPKKFLNDLFNLKLTDYVEIFEISKTGSLKHIV